MEGYMTITTWIMIGAVFLGPIVAVQLTRYLDDKKEVRMRKLDVFKTLMATRSYTISWSHIEALNRIDLEFDINNAKEKEVLDAWKEYLDLLNNLTIQGEAWNIKQVDLLIELLHKMAHVLNYDFDKTHIKNSSYSPRIHGEIENEQTVIRKGMIEILQGERQIPMKITNWPSDN